MGGWGGGARGWEKSQNLSCSECPETHFAFGIFGNQTDFFKMADSGNFRSHFGVPKLGLDHGFLVITDRKGR